MHCGEVTHRVLDGAHLISHVASRAGNGAGDDEADDRSDDEGGGHQAENHDQGHLEGRADVIVELRDLLVGDGDQRIDVGHYLGPEVGGCLESGSGLGPIASARIRTDGIDGRLVRGHGSLEIGKRGPLFRAQAGLFVGCQARGDGLVRRGDLRVHLGLSVGLPGEDHAIRGRAGLVEEGGIQVGQMPGRNHAFGTSLSGLVLDRSQVRHCDGSDNREEGKERSRASKDLGADGQVHHQTPRSIAKAGATRGKAGLAGALWR